MRSARLFRNDNAVRVFRPLWDSSRTHKFGGSSLTKKTHDSPERDPYEGNFIFTDCDQYTKVTVIGAAGRVGRTLSLLLKTCPLIDHLCLFDTDKSVKGIGVDISHVDTKCTVSYVCGMRNIHQALDAPDVVIVAAGCPASPTLTGQKLFEKNAPIVAGLSEACARFCPKACVVLITSPINSLLPVMGEVYQIITNRIPSRKLFGLTTLDVVRANTFVAEVVRKDPNNIIVPVIGGTSQETIVPVISQMKPCCKIKRGEMIALTECLKRAEGNLADCQNCGTRGASSLSTAYAGFRFTSSLVMALKGAEDIIECAFVRSDVIPELEYLASPVKLGIRGIEYNFGYPPLSDHEVSLMEQAAPFLISDIEMGKCFVIEQQKKQKKLFRRCPNKNPESFLSVCANLPKNHCCQDLEESTQQGRKPCMIDALNKSGQGKCPFEIVENRINCTPEEEEGEEKQQNNNNNKPSFSFDRGKNVILKKFWLESSWRYEEEPITNLDKRRTEKPESRRKISRKQIFLNTIERLDDLNENVKKTQDDGRARRKPLFQPRWSLTRGYHTAQEERPWLEEPITRKNTPEIFKKYLLNDRSKTLVAVKRTKPSPEPPATETRREKLRQKKPETTLKRLVWEMKVPVDQYKNLNAAAKQKFRSFNVQRKFAPSAPVLLLAEKKRREQEMMRKIGLVLRKGGQKAEETPENVSEGKAEEKEEEAKPTSTGLVVSAKDEITKYKGYIFEQLRQLKRENEELKKRISDIVQDKSLQSAIQAQSNSLELEKTKLQACWLIMSSTMDAFSNFCKKFTTKSDEQILQETKECHESDQRAVEGTEDDDEKEMKQERPSRYDESYYRYLEKLMEGDLEDKKRVCREIQKL